MYTLSESRGGNREAFDALENAFGSQEFSDFEATVVLQNTFSTNEEDATKCMRGLIKSGMMVEVD